MFKPGELLHLFTSMVEESTETGGDIPSDGNEEKQEHTTQSDTAKEFSRALAKRVEQIEAKYADYDQLKAKLAEYEAQASADSETSKTLEERIAALEQERDTAQAELAHSKLVDQLAHDSGVDKQIISMLAGDGDELESKVKQLAELLKSKQSTGLHTAPTSHSGTKLSAKQLLAQAYNK